jgi:hypothetical protein
VPLSYLFGSPGFLDFYIDEVNNWGYELLRNNVTLLDHLERFNPESGTYKNTPFSKYGVIILLKILLVKEKVLCGTKIGLLCSRKTRFDFKLE